MRGVEVESRQEEVEGGEGARWGRLESRSRGRRMGGKAFGQ